ncbi:SusD/RagB family nutrient-binding outer membrane lipoprotein [Chitinophaga vietnamensis]|uniref:SusD/RagB family nutrient-binding outer membrane lipoprotein n=1 Tax=Chitinophaga vietnamensis TaxID=2593957 RepID=UPI001178740B|nr:SusD/RagB family nutrient-binding outer membrane lipoprotein [Chitinophaga vietnamensis]
MKLLSRYMLLLAVPATALLASCTKNFSDINTDTNKVAPENNIPIYNLTRAELEFAGNHDFSFDTWRVNIIYCSLMTQQLSSTTGWYSGDKYSRNDGFASSAFTTAYQDQIKYVVDLVANTKGKPQYANLYQVGRIAKVLLFHRLTDLYGNIPYSQAGQGYLNGISTPKYDAQKDIYSDMLKELDEAAKGLDASKDKIGAGDLIYRGADDAVLKWKRLAYSLMLRLGMRMSKRTENDSARIWVEKAYAGGVFTSNDDNAYVQHESTGGRNTVNRNSNILSGEWDAVGKGNVYLSKTLVDFLQGNNDPRLQYLAQIKSSGDRTPSKQIGLPNGYDQNNGANDVKTAPGFPGDINNYSTIQKNFLLKLDGPTFVITYAQTELLLAEAAQRGWNVGANAATHYNNGVTAAMKQFAQYDKGATIADADIAAYLTAHPYVAASGLQQINTQYWMASFLDWYEAWSNWRRSDFPKLTPVVYPGDNNGGQIPRRMLYPTSEASANADNYNAAITAQGANNFSTRVWWDK